jgi:FkbM family methyltransferase
MEKKLNILAHASFIGKTGYANHAKSFFCALNKYANVKVRNLTVGDSWCGLSEKPHDKEEYFTDEMRNMLILQTLYEQDNTRKDYPIYGYDGSFIPDIHIVLNDVNNPYFYDNYDGYRIAYNVWESTEYPKDFFERLFYFHEVWVPSKWQKDNLIKQGYPKERISVVPEGVDPEVFKPTNEIDLSEKFTFLLFGRWEYRKSTSEIIRAFNEEFKNEDVNLVVCANNPFANDGFKTTEERIIANGLENKNLKIVNFPTREEYINYLKNGHVFISCARSEGWNLPLIEAMACGTPSIYSNWGAQLEFADGLGIPVKVTDFVSAKNQDNSFVGDYIEPDFNDLKLKMRMVYNDYKSFKENALLESETIHRNFNWDLVAKNANNILQKKVNDFVFVTTGNENYMPLIECLVKSLNEFSKFKIIVYGINCDVPFDYPNLIKRRLNIEEYSEHDRWFWKQYACIESINESFENFVWVDGDVVANFNIDNIINYFPYVGNYPLSDIHRQKEFYGFFYENGVKYEQLFNENLSKYLNVTPHLPFMHVCLFIYNKTCKWFFDEIINLYKSTDLNKYRHLFLWNDEGADNAIRSKFNLKNHLPLSNFDVSSYDGESYEFINNQLSDFYTFWEKDGPYNFNKIYGLQYIPENKKDIIYFHGNKNVDAANKMIDFIKIKRDNSFYESNNFYTSKNVITDFSDIKNIEGGTIWVAENYGWSHAIYHEIYNLQDYYLSRKKQINDGDIVVDLGGNIGIFNRWAYSQGASKVISFEPDRRYFELLKKNTSPNSILFNAAMSDRIGELSLFESDHLGGSNIFGVPSNTKNYKVRTYTLDFLFDTDLITHIDFLKVDVEGAEHLIFKGISDNNLSKVKTISMEYHHSHFNFDEKLRDDFINRFVSLGFNSYLLFMGTNNALQMIYFYR